MKDEDPEIKETARSLAKAGSISPAIFQHMINRLVERVEFLEGRLSQCETYRKDSQTKLTELIRGVNRLKSAVASINSEGWPQDTIYLHGQPFKARSVSQGHLNQLRRAEIEITDTMVDNGLERDSGP